MKQKEKRLPVKTAVRLNIRAIKLYFEKFPMMLISSAVQTAWSALTPYVNIYFSALVLDELMNGRDVARLQKLIMLTLLFTAGTMLV